MGVSHSVLLLLDDPTFEPWLEEHGVFLPRPWPRSRYPSPAEIRAVLDQQPAYTVEYSVGPGLWDAWIATDDRQRIAIWVRDFSGDEDAPLCRSADHGARTGAGALWSDAGRC